MSRARRPPEEPARTREVSPAVRDELAGRIAAARRAKAAAHGRYLSGDEIDRACGESAGPEPANPARSAK